jgi:hypothetical protein
LATGTVRDTAKNTTDNVGIDWNAVCGILPIVWLSLRFVGIAFFFKTIILTSVNPLDHSHTQSKKR